ncbi:MAG: hypothetical protein NVS1B16_13280 [Pseudarthrobacter sp.]
MRIVSDPAGAGLADCLEQDLRLGFGNVDHQGVQLRHGFILPSRRRKWEQFSLLIRRAGPIMGMYTDWGNLKIVSRGAWLEGRTRQLNGIP